MRAAEGPAKLLQHRKLEQHTQKGNLKGCCGLWILHVWSPPNPHFLMCSSLLCSFHCHTNKLVENVRKPKHNSRKPKKTHNALATTLISVLVYKSLFFCFFCRGFPTFGQRPKKPRGNKITLLRVIPTMTCRVVVVRWGLLFSSCGLSGGGCKANTCTVPAAALLCN